MTDQFMRVPVWCPVCQALMKGKSTFSYMSFGCCITCQIYFVEGREGRWKSGWRPSEQEIEVYRSSLQPPSIS